MEFARGPAPLAGQVSTVAMTVVRDRVVRYAAFVAVGGGVGPGSRVE